MVTRRSVAVREDADTEDAVGTDTACSLLDLWWQSLWGAAVEAAAHSRCRRLDGPEQYQRPIYLRLHSPDIQLD